MRRITLWLVATVVVVVLLFSYRTSLNSGNVSRPGAERSLAPGVVAGPANAAAATAGQAGAGRPAQAGGSSPSSGAETVVNGTVAQTVWGPVQVQVTISAGKISDVIALQVPDQSFRDQQINSYAVPQLRQEVLSAQSAHVDTVSGATVTSDGYVRSLQAALDSVHFGR